MNYQLLVEEDLPSKIRNSCDLDGNFCNIDLLRGYLRSVKQAGNNLLEYDLLFKVAEVVLTIPHSNASEEQIVSYINKKKTPSRSSLQSNGTLSSILVIKTHISNPLEWQPCKKQRKLQKNTIQEISPNKPHLSLTSRYIYIYFF